MWYIFAWLADQLSHPLVDKGVFKGREAAWPSQEITELPDSVAKYLYGTAIPVTIRFYLLLQHLF